MYHYCSSEYCHSILHWCVNVMHNFETYSGTSILHLSKFDFVLFDAATVFSTKQKRVYQIILAEVLKMFATKLIAMF